MIDTPSGPRAIHQQDQIKLHLQNESDTRQFAEDMALALQPGDTLALVGDLGAGKSTLARALIRVLGDDPELEVPSPTFTLVQEYPLAGRIARIRHYDLYRLSEPEEFRELGFNENVEHSVSIVEWPERAAGELPQNSVIIRFGFPAIGGRSITIEAEPETLKRISRSLAIRHFLDAGWGRGVCRRFMFGDASTRAYETATLAGETRILMNAPATPDGPPVKNGKPYSQIAHLAEDVRAFSGVGTLLRKKGLCAPRIHVEDFEAGLLLIEHLGTGSVLVDGAPVHERYLAAAETLAAMHDMTWENEVRLANGQRHRIPPFDHDAMMIEVELLTRWYAPYVNGKELAEKDQQEFEAIWTRLIERLQQAEKSIVLRDYHSPNIIWREDETGTDRTGLIDFQDAMIGPAAYDLASVAQDARVTVSAALERQMIERYAALRKAKSFNEEAFREAYAIMAAQRATKVLGIFVRLKVRDGKPAYLAHIPRLHDYLKRTLPHPALAELRQWYERVLGSGLVS